MDRKLVTILAADVVGYSTLMEQDEQGTFERLRAGRKELFEPEIARHHGRIFKLMGDGLLAEFGSVVDAVECAVSLQRGLAERNVNVPEDQRIQVRIGINLGEVIVEGDDCYGDGVNIAARLEQLADPGGICVSAKVAREVEKKLSFGFEPMGERHVKNILEPVSVYRVLTESGAMRRRDLKSLVGRRRSWLSLAALTVMVLLAAVLVWNILPHESTTRLSVPDNPSIAVLPFKNLSGDPDQGYFVDGITENLIAALSRFPDLFVIASTSTFTYKDKPIKVRQVGQELGVRYVLEGNVQRAQDRVRVTAQLIEASSERHLWAQSYERGLDDIFAIQGEVVASITDALGRVRGEIAVAEIDRAKQKNTENWRAYDYVLRGYALLENFTKEDNDKAREAYEAAIKLDPDYAQAHAGLSFTYLMGGQLKFDTSPKESLRQAFEIAKRAVALDESNVEARWALGYAYLYRRQHELALAEYKRGLELNPNYADLMGDAVFLLAYMGRAKEGIPLMERAMRLNPIYPDWYSWNFGLAHYTMHEYADAIANLKAEDLPVQFQLYLAASYAQLGRLEEARAKVQKILEQDATVTIESWAKDEPDANAADLAHLIDGLRKAGLPQ